MGVTVQMIRSSAREWKIAIWIYYQPSLHRPDPNPKPLAVEQYQSYYNTYENWVQSMGHLDVATVRMAWSGGACSWNCM